MNDVEQAAPRRRAGLDFEWGAEPDEFLLFAPQKFIMFGMSVLVVLISLSCWVFANHYFFTLWAALLTIIIGLVVFLPEFFCHLINIAIQFGIWIAFFLFCLVRWIQVLFWKISEESDYYEQGAYTYLLIALPVEWIASAIVVFILFRILYLMYQNR